MSGLTFSVICLIFGWSCAETGVGFNDPYESLAIQDILWFYYIWIECYKMKGLSLAEDWRQEIACLFWYICYSYEISNRLCMIFLTLASCELSLVDILTTSLKYCKTPSSTKQFLFFFFNYLKIWRHSYAPGHTKYSGWRSDCHITSNSLHILNFIMNIIIVSSSWEEMGL